MVGRDCFLGYSNDGGLTWSVSDDSGECGEEILEGVAFGNGTWVVVGSSETIFRSNDGKEWKDITSDIIPDDEYNFESVAWDGVDLWMAGGEGGKLVFSQDNGETWAAVDGTIFGGNRLQGIAADGKGRWVAVSDGGVVAYSDTPTDSASWSATQVMGLDFESVAFVQDGFIAVGGSGTIYVSEDGISWELRSGICEGTDIEDVAINRNGQWMVVGENGCVAVSEPPENEILTEYNISSSLGGVGGCHLSSVDRWVVADSNGMVFYSDDSGQTWSRAVDDSVLSGMTPLLIRRDL